MAHRLKEWLPWIGTALLACAVVAIGYLPQYGSPREPWFRRPSDPERLRAAALAAEWRAADQALRLAQYRERLDTRLTAKREAGVGGAVVDFSSSLPPAAQMRVLAALDAVWRELDLGVPKVSVGLVVEAGQLETRTTPGAPRRPRGSGAAFLVPDSAHRHSCVAYASVNYWTRNLATDPARIPEARLREWLRAALGVCAFYAALGTPGDEIGRWLDARRFDLALVPAWNSPRPPVGGLEFFGFDDTGTPPRWFWRDLYAHPLHAVGCVAGKAPACRAAILAGIEGTSAPSFATTDQWWRRRGLVRGGSWLSDLLHHEGRSRARRFWSSDLPVDSAFRVALGADIGEWTRDWEAERVPVLRFGATAPLGAAGLAVALAGLCLAAAAVSAMRREIG